jgi:hypothetical protein
MRFAVPTAGGESVGRAEVGPLPEGPGAGLRKADRDVESLWADAGSVWLGFERSNAVWRFDRRSWHSLSQAAPPAMAGWPKNRGPEGQGGEVLLFAGDPSVPGTAAARLSYVPAPRYRTTDAALLPDGRALLLNRRWTLLQGFTSKLSLVPLGGLRPGAVLRGAELADLRPPLASDNFEGLSVTREGGRTIVWITSDDNYVPLQRTLLLKFALVG